MKCRECSRYFKCSTITNVCYHKWTADIIGNCVCNDCCKSISLQVHQCNHILISEEEVIALIL